MRALAGISFLMLIGLLTGASMLVYAAYVLVAIYVVTRYLSRKWADSLVVSRKSVAHEVEIGQTVLINFKLENAGKLPIVWILLEDVLPRGALVGPPPALKLEGANLRLCSLPSGTPKLHSYKLTALRRGYYQIGPLIAETGDLFGLHRRFKTVSQIETLLVLPKIVPLVGYEVASQRPVGEVKVTYRLLEDPTLISGIRKYQNGDPMRAVHWRASARTGTLQSKQYQPTSVAGVTLVLDLHRSSNPDHHEPIRSDLAITAAASIAHTLMQMQQQFGLITNGRDAADRMAEEQQREYASRESARREAAMRQRSDRLRPIVVPPARGAEHFIQLHKLLARVERTDGLKLPDLLVETQSRMSRDATVLVIVQEVDDAAALALGMLKRQGYSVAAIVNNYENDAFESATARLMAQRISVYHLLDEQAIAHICTQMVMVS